MSRNEDFLIYSCTSWAGDSGSAVLLINGEVVGVHVMGINQVKEQIDNKSTVDERLSAIEESVESITQNTSSGALAVFIKSKAVIGAKVIDGPIGGP